MRSDRELLEEYVTCQSDKAFSALVGRHLPLVYSLAWRQTQDGELAKDIAQQVFLDVAKNARSLMQVRVLPGWLYQHTVFLSRRAVRSEHRRKARELQVYGTGDEETEAQLPGMIFDAMEKLKPAERDVLILRYLESRSLKEVGEVLRCSEEAARKRIDRALETLRKKLGRTGGSGALMGTALGTFLITVPSGLAATIMAASGATVVKGSILTFTILEIMKNKAKAVAVAAVLAGAVTAPLVMLKQNSANTGERRGDEPFVMAGEARQTETVDRVTDSRTALAGFSWVAIESTNFFQYMENLRRIGCPEETIKDIIVSEVTTLFKERRRGMRAFSEPIAFWKSGVQLKGAARERLKEIDAKLLEEKGALLKELLGANFEVREEQPVYTRAELDKQLLKFVKDPQKRESAERMRDEVEAIFDQDILPLTEGGLNETERVKYVEFREMEREKMKRILTPEELEEFELRASILADRLRYDFVGFSLTEDEFRQIFREAKQFQLALDPYYWGGDEKLMAEQMALRAQIRERVGDIVGERRKLEGDAARQGILQATLDGMVAGRTRAEGQKTD